MGGCIFIYSRSARRISFEISCHYRWFQKKFVGQNTNIWICTPPPPPINALVSALTSWYFRTAVKYWLFFWPLWTKCKRNTYLINICKSETLIISLRLWKIPMSLSRRFTSTIKHSHRIFIWLSNPYLTSIL